jgi:hypothetical protein
MGNPRKAELVLAIHPTARGFGWVIFEAPLAPYDWGIASAKPGRNARLMTRFERLIARYSPTILVLEDFERRERAERIKYLCRWMVHLAHCQGMGTPVYSLAAVRTCFASTGARSRHEIATVISQQLPAFSHRLPNKRKAWAGADPRQSLFDAAALAMTHYAVSSTVLNRREGSGSL